MKHGLRNTYIHRLLGERIFHHIIWGLDKKSLAGGLSLGMFIAFTPTIPFQMILCAMGAIVLRVNMPIGLAACWITNPVTALPVFLTARHLGQFMLARTGISKEILDLFSFEMLAGRFMEQTLYLWAGSLIFSIIAAFLGYGTIHFLYALNRWLTDRKSGESNKSMNA